MEGTMARMLILGMKVVAAGLVLGSCVAANPWLEWRESAMLLDAPAHTDARMVSSDQLFDD